MQTVAGMLGEHTLSPYVTVCRTVQRARHLGNGILMSPKDCSGGLHRAESNV